MDGRSSKNRRKHKSRRNSGSFSLAKANGKEPILDGTEEGHENPHLQNKPNPPPPPDIEFPDPPNKESFPFKGKGKKKSSSGSVASSKGDEKEPSRRNSPTTTPENTRKGGGTHDKLNLPSKELPRTSTPKSSGTSTPKSSVTITPKSSGTSTPKSSGITSPNSSGANTPASNGTSTPVRGGVGLSGASTKPKVDPSKCLGTTSVTNTKASSTIPKVDSKGPSPAKVPPVGGSSNKEKKLKDATSYSSPQGSRGAPPDSSSPESKEAPSDSSSPESKEAPLDSSSPESKEAPSDSSSPGSKEAPPDSSSQGSNEVPPDSSPPESKTKNRYGYPYTRFEQVNYNTKPYRLDSKGHFIKENKPLAGDVIMNPPVFSGFQFESRQVAKAILCAQSQGIINKTPWRLKAPPGVKLVTQSWIWEEVMKAKKDKEKKNQSAT